MERKFGNFDWLIFLPVFVLAGFSLATLSSGGNNLWFFQSAFFFTGVLISFLLSKIDFTFHKNLAVIYYFFSIFLLFITMFSMGNRGSSRWIDIGGFRFQSSELVKPFLTIFFAWFFSSFRPENLKNIFFGLLLLILPFFLIFRQPDLGTSIIVLGIFAGIIYGAGLPIVWGTFGTLGILGTFPLLWHFLKDYQKLRITSFLNPYLDPQGAGYHSLQAMIAVGAGGFLGRGLGEGTQTKLQFLPEYNTDFIFASIVESFGFLAGFLVIFGYGVLLWRLLVILGKTRESFARLFVMGTFTQIFLQVFVNIGMNMGLIPITGITLPFLSYGGSSVVSLFISLGIILNIKNFQSREAVDILS